MLGSFRSNVTVGIAVLVGIAGLSNTALPHGRLPLLPIHLAQAPKTTHSPECQCASPASSLPLVCAARPAARSGDYDSDTVNQGNTLPELQYEQVLDNLAQFAVNPSALPWQMNLKEGTSQVTDSLSGGAALDIGPPVGWFPQLLGSRTVVAQWGMAPVVDPTELQLLRIAYRRAYGLPDMPSPEFLDELAHELKDQFASNADLRNESELFYDFHGRSSRDARHLEARRRHSERRNFLRAGRCHGRPLAVGEERLPEDRVDPARPDADSTWLVPCRSQAGRPEGRMLRREERAYLRVGLCRRSRGTDAVHTSRPETL